MIHEQLFIQRHKPLIVREFDYDHFSYPWHYHSEYEIIYIKESSGQRFIADHIGTFKAGDLLLLGPNLPHYLKNEVAYYQKGSQLRVRGVIIQFERRFMSHSIENYAELLPVRKMLEMSCLGLSFSPSSINPLASLIEHLPQITEIDRIAAVLNLLVRLSQLSGFQQLGSPGFSNALDFFEGTRMEKVQNYLLHHYTEEVTLDKVASIAAMNTTAFCRYFKEKSGKTLTEYIMTLRMGFACRLLLSNTQTVGQISMECGFNSITHFNRVFKRHTGFTPSEYKLRFT